MKTAWFLLPFPLCCMSVVMAGQRDLMMGGRNATPGEFPFFVAGTSGCGGTLVHEDVVLTAAHCIVGGNTFREGVQVGGTFRPGALAQDPTLRDEEEERIGFACALIHPGYNHSVIGVDDIALVKLARPSAKRTIRVNFNESLPTEGDAVTAIGYGAYGYRRIPGSLSEPLYPTYLQVLSPMTIQSEDACRAGERNFGHYSPDYLLCIDDDNPVTTDCRADSGGPIFFRTTKDDDEAENWLQLGLLVYGPNFPVSGECRGDRPSYYTNTAMYEAFIRDGICQLAEHPPSDCPPISTSPVVECQFSAAPVLVSTMTLPPLEIQPTEGGTGRSKGLKSSNHGVLQTPSDKSRKRKSSGKRHLRPNRRQRGS